MFDAKAFGEQIVASVKDYVARAVANVSDRLSALEQRFDQIPAPKDGIDGKDGAPGEKGDPGINGERGERGEVGPQGERGLKGDPGERGERGEPGEKGEPGERGERGEPGLRGDHGDKGDTGERGEVGPQGERGAVGEKGERGERGEQGIQGIAGKSLTPDEVRTVFADLFIAEYSKWALEFERRAQDLIQRFLDRIPPPKDGANGADGANGLGFDDLQFVHDGERSFTLRFARDKQVKEFTFTIPAVIDRGIYKSDGKYQLGDGVTFGGSYWIAQKDTTAKPGDTSDWRLAVRKGRDGKDGEPGKKGDPGPKAKDAGDTTALSSSRIF